MTKKGTKKKPRSGGDKGWTTDLAKDALRLGLVERRRCGGGGHGCPVSEPPTAIELVDWWSPERNQGLGFTWF